uniref:Lectin n=1 Tax=Panagrolaimus superbus TaxID=310955 RepID=A0A914Y1Q5_9BILA
MAFCTFVQKTSCLFDENVFDGYNTAENENNIAQVASPNGNCEIIILNRPVVIFDDLGVNLKYLTHSVKHFWTTSKNQAVKVYRGSVEDELMLEFNSTNGDVWSNFILASTWYTITVPVNSSVYMEFTKFADNTLQISKPGKTLWGTAYYGSKNSAPLRQDTPNIGVLEIYENIVANIKILKFNVSSSGAFNFSLEYGEIHGQEQWK